MEPVTYTPIGIIHTPFSEPKGTPIQPSGSSYAKGCIKLLPEYVDGLQDLDGFSHIVLVYHFHLSRGYDLSVTPFLDTQQRGLFATRAPRRPNAIGLSVVRLLEINGSTLHIEDVDMVDGTPLLDIKPYVPAFEDITEFRQGWLEEKARHVEDTTADDRFDI